MVWRRLKYIIINTTVFLREIMFQIILKYVQMKRAFLHTMKKKCRCTFLCLPRLNPSFLSHLISCFISHWGVPNNFRLHWLYSPVRSNVYGLQWTFPSTGHRLILVYDKFFSGPEWNDLFHFSENAFFLYMKLWWQYMVIVFLIALWGTN